MSKKAKVITEVKDFFKRRDLSLDDLPIFIKNEINTIACHIEMDWISFQMENMRQCPQTWDFECKFQFDKAMNDFIEWENAWLKAMHIHCGRMQSAINIALAFFEMQGNGDTHDIDSGGAAHFIYVR